MKTNNDFDRRLHGLESHGATSQEAAAAGRDDDGVDVRNLLQNLKSGGSLTGDDVRMIEPVASIAKITTTMSLRASQW